MSFVNGLESLWSLLNGGFAVACSVTLLRSRRILQYPLLFTFGLVTGAFTALALCHRAAWVTVRTYAQWYWAAELFEQGFALALMVAVMRRALNGKRPAAITSQALASVFVVLVAVLLCEGAMAYNGRWMTGFTRNLSFGVALLNFQVWGTVLGEKVRSREILLLAAGLGMLTTGKSLGHTIRLLSPSGGWVAGVGGHIVILTSILASVAWWYAVRTPDRPAKEKRLKLVKAA